METRHSRNTTQDEKCGSLASAEWFKFKSALKRPKRDGYGGGGDGDANSQETRIKNLEDAVTKLQAAVRGLSARLDAGRAKATTQGQLDYLTDVSFGERRDFRS